MFTHQPPSGIANAYESSHVYFLNPSLLIIVQQRRYLHRSVGCRLSSWSLLVHLLVPFFRPIPSDAAVDVAFDLIDWLGILEPRTRIQDVVHTIPIVGPYLGLDILVRLDSTVFCILPEQLLKRATQRKSRLVLLQYVEAERNDVLG